VKVMRGRAPDSAPGGAQVADGHGARLCAPRARPLPCNRLGAGSHCRQVAFCAKWSPAVRPLLSIPPLL